MNLAAIYTHFYSNYNTVFAIPNISHLKYKFYYYTNNKTMIEKLKETANYHCAYCFFNMKYKKIIVLYSRPNIIYIKYLRN